LSKLSTPTVYAQVASAARLIGTTNVVSSGGRRVAEDEGETSQGWNMTEGEAPN
jgi:hypothetical protein